MEYTDVLLIAVIMAMVQFFKAMGATKKILPLSALFLGLIGGVFYIYPGDLKAGILTGLIMGLAASGFIQAVKQLSKRTDE